jgi:hypothetical protein
MYYVWIRMDYDVQRLDGKSEEKLQTLIGKNNLKSGNKERQKSIILCK